MGTTNNAVKQAVITTGATLRSFIDNVIKESLKSGLHQSALREKEKQDATSGAPSDGGGGDTDLFSDDGSGDDGGGNKPDQEQPEQSKTMDDESSKLQQGDIEPKDIIEKLNSIRSGKSFKDDNVKHAMDEYIGSLSKAERVALLAFTRGIAQIVTGEVQGQNADEPGEHPADVHMQKGEERKEKQIKPNVIAAKPPKPKSSGGAENTAAPSGSPAPITPKRRG